MPRLSGFILGIISSDHDIDTIYIDSITKHANISLDNISVFIDRLDAISKQHEVEFIVSVSADAEDIQGILADHEVLN